MNYVLNEIEESYEEFHGGFDGWESLLAYEDYDSDWADDNNFSILDGEGGSEGGGEYCYRVFSWKEKVYKVEFSYYSFSGCDMDSIWDTLKEVKPVQKTVTVYE